MTRAELDMLVKVSRDPWFFSTFARIIHPIMGKVPFALYPFQKVVLYAFLHNQFNVIVKCRQMGLTELMGLYVLWLAMFHPYKNIVMISLKDRVAKKLLRRIKHIYKNLPPIFQTPIENGRKGDYGTASEMVFSNHSSITSVPTTEDAGRSEAVSLLVMDEAAIMQYAEIIWTAAFPTLATGGSAIVNSTPYGIGNFFYNTFTEALNGSNGFNPIKLTWDMHPDRDQAWYNKMRSALGAKRTAQEIDGDFLSSGDTVFDLSDIKAIEDELVYIRPVEKRLNGTLLIFERPIPGMQYYLGADIASGRAKDYSALSIMKKNGEEVAAFKGRISTNRMRDLIFNLGKEYNWALVAPEANDIGEAVTSGLQERNYPNLYYTEQVVKEKNNSKPIVRKVPGWYTTGKNRGTIITALEEDIRQEILTIADPFFVSEAYTFIYDAANRPVAMNKGEYIGDGSETYSDDAIMAKAITNFIRRRGMPLANTTTSPR
jgi:hypothetical protein